jgi:hypothetical protein
MKRLIAGLVTAALVAIPGMVAMTGSPASAAGTSVEAQVLSLINSDRAAAGLPALVELTSLTSVAESWAARMESAGALSHNPNLPSQIPTGWSSYGEDVGSGATPQAIEQAFMADPAHRDNILGGYTEVGVGADEAPNGMLYVTVDLVQPGSGQPVAAAGACSDSDPIDVPSANAARGYYVLGNDGGIFSYGNAPFYGSVPGDGLHIHAVLMSLTPDQAGYWILGADGGVFSFGDAGYYGSAAGTGLTAIDLKPTADGHGYWVLGSNGTVDGFGDAPAYGSLTGAHAPAVKLVPTPDGHGYWILTTDGNVYSFGDAATHGNLPALGIHDTAVSMAATTDGNGYWILGADGGIFSFGDAAYHGSIPGLGCQTATGVQLIATHTGNGYYILSTDGRVFPFGDAPSYGQPFNLGVTTTDLAVRG